jgi:hypothetical protein
MTRVLEIKVFWRRPRYRRRSCDLSQPIHLFCRPAAAEKTDPQHGLCSCKSWPRPHEADGGQEELDGRWVSLPSGSSRRRCNLQLQSMRSCFASDFVVLVLSPPRRTVLSETVLVLDGCLNCCDAARRSKRFAGTCGPIGRIAILDRFEYEYEKKHEQSIGPKCSIGRF